MPHLNEPLSDPMPRDGGGAGTANTSNAANTSDPANTANEAHTSDTAHTCDTANTSKHPNINSGNSETQDALKLTYDIAKKVIGLALVLI